MWESLHGAAASVLLKRALTYQSFAYAHISETDLLSKQSVPVVTTVEHYGKRSG